MVKVLERGTNIGALTRLHGNTLAMTGQIRSNSAMAESRKHDIQVSVATEYLAEQSDPEAGRYVFAYTVTVENTGSVGAQLISRHWIITDGNQEEQEVRGLGVVGQQPLIAPGDSYEYSSGCSLATPVGTMRGTYQMASEDGTQFEATIPEFALFVPGVLH